MAEGGGGRRERKALSFFRFPLPPFPPKTPDTQSKQEPIWAPGLNESFLGSSMSRV